MKKRKKSASKKKTTNPRSSKQQLDAETSRQLEFARKIMAEYREVLEELAKSQ